MEQQVFENILEKDEKIIKMWRPNKAKFWWFWMLTYIGSMIWVFAVPLVVGIEDGAGTGLWVALGATGGVFVFGWIVMWVAGALWLKNRYYAYTERRILIRGGIIGIDYKSLEYKSLNATVVKVSLLDKLVRRDTGTIKFGSPSSPVLSIWAGHSNQYMFNHIEAPYATLREIKEYMNDLEEKSDAKK